MRYGGCGMLEHHEHPRRWEVSRAGSECTIGRVAEPGLAAERSDFDLAFPRFPTSGVCERVTDGEYANDPIQQEG